MNTAEVIVVGAGPVGLMVAAELRLGGAEVIVLEQLSAPTGESRASQLNARTMEIYDQRGILDRVGQPPRETTGHFGGLPMAVDRATASVYSGYWKAPQFETEAMLADWATELGADIRRGHQVRDLRQRDGEVLVDADGPGGPVRFQAAFVVGCDGERSVVRRRAGFEFPGADTTRELLRADVSGIEIRDRRFERTDTGMSVAWRRPDGVTRVMVHEFGRAAIPRSGAPEFAEMVAAWRRVTGEDIGGGTPIWVDAFGNASRQAARYRQGRVLLAGDAAHVQMPIGGQALNLGLQDAVNLGWKLAAEVRGWAPDGLLDSYHQERHPVGARVLDNVAAQALLQLGGPEVEPMRAVMREVLAGELAREHLTNLLSGLDIRYPVGPGDHPLLGVRAPRWSLVTGSGATNTWELLRSATGVLLDLSAVDSQWDEPGTLGVGWDGWADRVRVVRAVPSGTDPLLTGVRALLVRPDGHIAAVDTGSVDAGSVDAGSANPGSVENALHRFFGEPSGSGEPRGLITRATVTTR